MTWPNDSDGDVFRHLAEHGFDFSKSYTVDYNVDFETWPPAKEAIAALGAMFGDVWVFDPEDDYAGYAQFRIHGPVSYEGVTSTQRRASDAMSPYGGICESWGLMQGGD